MNSSPAQSSALIFPTAFLAMWVAVAVTMTTANRATAQIPPLPSGMAEAQNGTPGGTGAFSFTSKSFKKHTSAESSILHGPPAIDPLEFSKRDSDFSLSLRSRIADAADSVVRLENGRGDYILGTVISTDGMIVSKHSVAKSMKHCILNDSMRRPFRIVASDLKKDLCLIRVNQRGLTPIKFRSDLNVRQPLRNGFNSSYSVSLKPPATGSLALSVGHQKEVAAFGMVTFGHHDFEIEQPQCPECIDIGITVSPYPSLTRINGVVYPFRKGIKVLRVYPRSVGERVGLLVGDLINTVNGVTIAERQIFDRETKKIRSGDVMTMKVFRRGLAKHLTFKVPAAKKTLYDRWGGGPYSERRFGFGSVIVHDSVISPQDCGGPLVDINGQVIGINMARAMRVASFAINIEDVYLFLKSRSPETKLQFEN